MRRGDGGAVCGAARWSSVRVCRRRVLVACVGGLWGVGLCQLFFPCERSCSLWCAPSCWRCSFLCCVAFIGLAASCLSVVLARGAALPWLAALSRVCASDAERWPLCVEAAEL